MAPDDPSDMSTPTRPKKGLSVRSTMAIIVFVALLLGLILQRDRAQRRSARMMHRAIEWWGEVRADNPSAGFDGYRTGSPLDWQGAGFFFEANFKTPTGRRIAIEGETRFGFFRHDGRVVFTSEGHTVSWPIEDIERGRKIDLKAEFPEAFR